MKEYYKKENFKKIVKESFSLSEVIRKIGLIDKGNTFNTIKKYITLYDIDTSHFKGLTWNKDQKYTNYTAYNDINDILKNNINFNSDILKYRLVKEGLKEWKCEKCGNTGNWNNEKLILLLHHINGNHFDNRLENLLILCPNCHSQTQNFCGKNHKKIKIESNHRTIHICTCDFCKKEFRADRKSRRFCCLEHYKEFLKKDKQQNEIIKEKLIESFSKCKSISELANYLHKSRTLIRKYLKLYNLLEIFKLKYATNTIHSKCVLQYDINMNFIKKWPSIKDAKETLSISTIDKCLQNRLKSAGGFIWRYDE